MTAYQILAVLRLLDLFHLIIVNVKNWPSYNWVVNLLKPCYAAENGGSTLTYPIGMLIIHNICLISLICYFYNHFKYSTENNKKSVRNEKSKQHEKILVSNSVQA